MRALKRLSAAQKWVVVLIVITLALGASNLGKAVVALHYARRLPDLPTTVSFGYLAAVGGFWGVAFVVCSLGLSRFWAWGRWSTLVAVTVYQVHVWINHLLFDASDYARQTRPRDLVLTGTLLLVFWVSLNLPAVRRAFRQRDENR